MLFVKSLSWLKLVKIKRKRMFEWGHVVSMYGIVMRCNCLQIDSSLTAQKVLPVGTIGADGSEAFRSKLKFQIQHEVFR